MVLQPRTTDYDRVAGGTDLTASRPTDVPTNVPTAGAALQRYPTRRGLAWPDAGRRGRPELLDCSADLLGAGSRAVEPDVDPTGAVMGTRGRRWGRCRDRLSLRRAGRRAACNRNTEAAVVKASCLPPPGRYCLAAGCARVVRCCQRGPSRHAKRLGGRRGRARAADGGRRALSPRRYTVKRAEVVDRLLTVEQAADRLGTSPRFIRRLIAERRIAFTRLGRHVRIGVLDLDNSVSAGRVEPARRRTS